MQANRALSAMCAAALLAGAVSAQTSVNDIDAHINAAKAAAGLDYRATFVNLCFAGANPALANPAAGRSGAPARGTGPGAPDRTTWYASPYKVFDNLYWLGTRQHSSWALRTTDGLVILDTNFWWATQPEIIEGLKTLALDPRQIKYVLISHAHGDHDQGA
ncbi:MAG TPA: MBL fold metallo-hydrolase, partial [Vicinamibacterales bacterium]|nr:MBL fold metallo-hydrolase [Vicinamibacterales bacterium]